MRHNGGSIPLNGSMEKILLLEDKRFSFAKLNDSLLQLHNTITGRNDTHEDTNRWFMNHDFSNEEFVHFTTGDF